MSRLKKMVSVVLVGVMALSMAACGGSKAKKISAEDFKSKLEEKGYTVMETEPTEEGVKSAVMAYNSDMSVIVNHNIFGSKDDAKKFFEDMKSSAEEAKKAGSIDKLSTSSSKITADGGDEGYVVVVYAEDMIIMATSMSGDADAVKECIKTLGV